MCVALAHDDGCPCVTALSFDEALLKLEAADWLQGFQEMKKSLFVHFEAAVGNRYCKNLSFLTNAD